MNLLTLNPNDIVEWISPREIRDETLYQAIKESIGKHGQWHPVKVRPHPSIEGKFQGFDGKTRADICKELGRTVLATPIAVHNDWEGYELAYRSNLEEGHGQPLNSLDEARYLKFLMKQFHLSQDELAKKLGFTQSWISLKLKILTQIPDPIKELLEQNKLHPRHAMEIARVKHSDAQIQLAEKAVKEKLTLHDVATYATALNNRQQLKASTILSKPLHKVKGFLETQERLSVEKELDALESDRIRSNVHICPYCSKPLRVVIDWKKKKVKALAKSNHR
jgi:ParB family chromosome partitioning protein